VDPEKDVIHVNGKKLLWSNQPKLYYFMVNKPKARNPVGLNYLPCPCIKFTDSAG
jgi:hypothetical protein